MRGERNKAAETLDDLLPKEVQWFKKWEKEYQDGGKQLSLSCCKAERNNHKYEIKV